MWIHHIGEIMFGVFIALIVVHVMLHIIFNRQKHNEIKNAEQEAAEQAEKTNLH